MFAAVAVCAVGAVSQELPAQQDPIQSATERVLQQFKGKVIRTIRFGRIRDGKFVPLAQGPADSLLRSLQSKANQPLDGRQLQSDLERLWRERKMAARVYLEAVENQVRVSFEVVFDDEVFDEIQFKGLQYFTVTEVQDSLGIFPGTPVSELQAQTLRNILEARYRREGFPFVSIQIRPDQTAHAGPPDQEGRRRYRTMSLLVDEGYRVTVRAIYLRGNRSIPWDLPWPRAGEIIKADAGMKTGQRLGFIAGDPFSIEILEEDLDRLRLFYRERGFRDAQVELADYQFTPDRSEVDVTFLVVEGPRYIVSSLELVRVEDDQALTPVPESEALYPKEEILARLRTAVGEPYDAVSIAADRRAIRKFYGELGHPEGSRIPDALVIHAVDELVDHEHREIRLRYLVTEGTPKTIRDVRILGNTYTKDEVIRNKVFQDPGDTLSIPLIDRSMRFLRALRYFMDPRTLQGPRITLEPVPGEPDKIDLQVKVVEGETGQLRWGVGVGTGSGVQATMSFNKHNFDLLKLPSSFNPMVFLPEILDNKAFHGAGQRLSLLLAPGTRISQFSVDWRDPDVFSLHRDTIGLGVSGAREIRRFEGYTTDRRLASVAFERNFTEDTSLRLSLSHETLEVEDPDPNAPLLVFDAEGQSELRTSRLTFRIRDLDDPVLPTDGVDLRVYGELGGGLWGGSESFYLGSINGDYYIPLFTNLRDHTHALRLRGQFGIGGGFGSSDDLFLTKRFFMGGRNLRGFDFRDAGPTQFGRPTGGEAIFTSSVEYQFPLVASHAAGVGRDQEILRAVVFSDYGMLGTRIDDDSFLEPRLSFGVGIRIQVPLLNASLALDLGWPVLFEETDDRQQFYFSLSGR